MSLDRSGATAVADRCLPEIVSVTPASGVWAVYQTGEVDGDTRYRREPVQVWALTRWSDGSTAVVPMIEGAGALELVTDRCLWLWSEANGDRCRCGYVSTPYYSSPDPWWCRVCAGLIEPPE